MEWKKVSQEVIDKAPEIIPLKKGELQIKYAEALVKIDKAIELCNIVISNEPLQAIPNEELLDQVCGIKEVLQDEKVEE